MKTPKSRRTVILPQDLLPALRQHKARQNEERLALGALYETHDLVFANEFGKPLQRDNLNHRGFKRILQAAGLPTNLRPYDLRHYAEFGIIGTRAPPCSWRRAATRRSLPNAWDTPQSC